MDGDEPISPEPGVCSRCGQLVVPVNDRCPRCGSPMSVHNKRVPILIGIAGVLALLFVIVLMVLVVHNEDMESDTTSQSAPK